MFIKTDCFYKTVCLYKTDSENKIMVIKEELGEKEITMKLTDAKYYI